MGDCSWLLLPPVGVGLSGEDITGTVSVVAIMAAPFKNDSKNEPIGSFSMDISVFRFLITPVL
jgi:hypothetical protein